MSKYDWSNPNQRYIEEIAFSRSIEEARRAFGFPSTLPEDATLSAALAETFAGGSRPLLNVVGFTQGTVINDGIGDATTALRAARAAQAAAKLSGSGGIFGSGADVGTSPTWHAPYGVYKITDYITNDVNEEVRHSTFTGDRAIIVASAGVKAFGGVAYGSSFKGLAFRGGANAISVKSNSIDSAIISIDEAEFHQQTDACIKTDSTSNAALLLVSRSKFMQTVAGLGHFLFLGTGDMAVLDRCWLEGEPVVAFEVTGVLIVRDSVGVPSGALAASGGRWCDLRTTSSQVYFDRFRFGGESGGGTFVRNYADMDTTADIEPTVISIKNSQAYAASVYAVEFYKLPNVFEFTNNYGLVGCLGLYFDSGLTNTDFRNFQEFGRVSIRDNYDSAGMPVELDGNVTTNGKLGMKVFTAARARQGELPIPLRARFAESEIKGSGEQGGFTSTENVSTSVSSVDDDYGVSRTKITATADEALRTYQLTTYLNVAVLTYGRIYTQNVVVDVEAEFAVVTIIVGGAKMRFPVTRGRHVLAVPFVYLNNGAASATYDTLTVSVDLRLNGDVVYIGRHILVEGIQRTADVLVIEGAAAPAGFTNGIGANTGYFRGDINHRSGVGLVVLARDLCTTEGAPGTWTQEGALSGMDTDVGNASRTLTAGTDWPTQRWNTPLTALRTVTFAAGAYKKARFHIIRQAGATGAFNLDIGSGGSLKSLTAAGQWCTVEYDGAAWVLIANGTL